MKHGTKIRSKAVDINIYELIKIICANNVKQVLGQFSRKNDFVRVLDFFGGKNIYLPN